MEYEQLFQVSNMADYFLQNRPMMIGLSIVVLVLLLTIYAYKKKDIKIILLVGLISGMLIKFQFFAVIVSLIIFSLLTIFYFRKGQFKFYLKSLFLFFFPFMICFLLFSSQGIVNNQSLVSLLKENFSFGPWEREKNFIWHLRFIISNFGIPFILTLIAFFWSVVRVVRKKKSNKDFVFLSVLSLIIFIIPYLIKFTIFKYDMFKFFYFTIIFSTIITFWFLDILISKGLILKIIFTFIIFTSTFSSFLTLANSFLNKNFAYSINDLQAGLWIREHTPQKAVFIAMPTVHTPVDQIGGRLRVLSYINWPYSQGYNWGEDNVFKRQEDIENLYMNSQSELAVSLIMNKYRADYIFYGLEEKNRFPEAEINFDKLANLVKVYNSDEVKIWLHTR